MQQRTISVPAEIDDLAKRMQDADPDMSYSVALRKILRAGMQAIASDDSILQGVTQFRMPSTEEEREAALERIR